MKTCTKCYGIFGLSEFPQHKEYKDGHSTWCRKCHSKQACEWSKNNREAALLNGKKSLQKPEVKRKKISYKMKIRYGIDIDQYEVILKSQNGTCLICKTPSNKTLQVDHCHKTGKVRGLLCGDCNRGIGLLKDSVNYLNNAIDYLNGHIEIKK
jgi:hypothetical protein